MPPVFGIKIGNGCFGDTLNIHKNHHGFISDKKPFVKIRYMGSIVD
jgi:hypothetical protein